MRDTFLTLIRRSTAPICTSLELFLSRYWARRRISLNSRVNKRRLVNLLKKRMRPESLHAVTSAVANLSHSH
jgi:hypothetical protein